MNPRPEVEVTITISVEDSNLVTRSKVPTMPRRWDRDAIAFLYSEYSCAMGIAPSGGHVIVLLEFSPALNGRTKVEIYSRADQRLYSRQRLTARLMELDADLICEMAAGTPSEPLIRQTVTPAPSAMFLDEESVTWDPGEPLSQRAPTVADRPIARAQK